jgi:kumamolisin
MTPEDEEFPPWSVPDLCRAYHWPSGLPGGGVIAIPAFSGCWRQSDMGLFFQSLNQPAPHIENVGVNNASEEINPELTMDIQVAAASYFVATGKPAVIRVYWQPDCEGATAAAIKQALSDGCDVFSTSAGADEAEPSDRTGLDFRLALEALAVEATQEGMILLAASGDNEPRTPGYVPAFVDWPSTCPHFIACGGTTKTAQKEVVWMEAASKESYGTTGGYSTIFPMPIWQRRAMPNAPQAKRMVPDISANATFYSYKLVVGMEETCDGGTSAVAPLYAGLFASFGRKLGLIAPRLWAHPQCFNKITEGHSAYFTASTSGPDPCTGLGSPIGTRLAELLCKS